MFKIFGARAAAELERMYATESLRQSEERLATILSSATDAIITIDGDHHITLFNQAAEQVFRCSAAWAVGQPFDRFLSASFRQFIAPFLDKCPAETHQVWAPEGITAVRADGEEFPIEATISPCRSSVRGFTPSSCAISTNGNSPGRKSTTCRPRTSTCRKRSGAGSASPR